MKTKFWGLACGLSLAAGAVTAAPQYAAIELGEGLIMTPGLDINLEYDDNIFQSSSNKKSSFITRVAPAVEWQARQEHARFTLGYAGNYGIFASSSDDNYDDHFVRADLDFEGARTDLNLYGSFEAAHDPRGTGPSDGLGDNVARDVFTKPTEYDEWAWGTSVVFRGSRTQLRAGYGYVDKKYQNFRQFTRDRDRSTDRFNVGVAYALTGKTNAVVNASRLKTDYSFERAGVPSLDSDQDRLTAGIEWEATARTTGSVQFGWEWKDFDDPARSKVDGFTWGAEIEWAPRTYSTFALFTENRFQETDNVGSAKDTSSVGLSWSHDWSDRLATTAGFDYAREKYKGFDRKDDFYRFSLGFDYDFRRWMTLGGGVRISSRDSNVVAADYDRNIVYLRAMMSL
jgi:hypothetical protein